MLVPPQPTSKLRYLKNSPNSKPNPTKGVSDLFGRSFPAFFWLSDSGVVVKANINSLDHFPGNVTTIHAEFAGKIVVYHLLFFFSFTELRDKSNLTVCLHDIHKGIYIPLWNYAAFNRHILVVWCHCVIIINIFFFALKYKNEYAFVKLSSNICRHNCNGYHRNRHLHQLSVVLIIIKE